MKLTGKNAIVTGSSRGIGRAIALELARKGANVLVCCQSRIDAAREVACEIERLGGQAAVIQSDLSEESGAVAVIRECQKEFGEINVLVNNAGVGIYTPVHLLEPEDIKRVLNTNLFSYIHLTKYAIANMIERGFPGCIVNVSSILSRVGIPGTSVYAASKGGIDAFTIAVAREVARYGIRVNAVSPGFIETEINRDWTPEYRERLIKKIPMRRFGDPEEVAKAVVFIIEDATYMTGQIVVLDGGRITD